MGVKQGNFSEQSGFMLGPDGAPRRVYRALVELRCHQCGVVLKPGALFARRARRSAGTGPPRALPHCRRCFPLRAMDGAGDRG